MKRAEPLYRKAWTKLESLHWPQVAPPATATTETVDEQLRALQTKTVAVGTSPSCVRRARTGERRQLIVAKSSGRNGSRSSWTASTQPIVPRAEAPGKRGSGKARTTRSLGSSSSRSEREQGLSTALRDKRQSQTHHQKRLTPCSLRRVGQLQLLLLLLLPSLSHADRRAVVLTRRRNLDRRSPDREFRERDR
jgi:hypothetical protein